MSNKMPLKNILGYGAAAIGYNFVYMMQSTFLNVFYTNVLGISLAAVGIIMLVARIWDGVNDPIMGSIVDKTNTKDGKYRPYIKWGIIPLALTSVLLYTAPNLSMSLKVLYAGITYIGFGMAYTFANIPYMSMQSTLSFDSNERTKIITIKNVFTLVGIIAASAIIPKIAITAEGASQSGFLTAGIIGAVIVALTMLITFASTKNYKYIEDKKHEKITFKQRKDAVVNNPALILSAFTLLALSLVMALAGSANYYFIDILKRGDLVMAFTMIGSLSMVVSMIFMPIAMKFEKKNVMGTGLLFYMIISILMYYLPEDKINLLIAFNVIRGIGMGFGMVLIWSMIADSVDYAALKTGQQQGGIVFSTSTFVQKAAGGIGAFLINILLAAVGFVPKAASQTAAATSGVKLLFTVVPGLVFGLVAIIILIKYPLSKKVMLDIQKQLGRE